MTDIVISSKADGKQLAKLEKRIEANTKAAWRENGLIMLHIRNSGLYKAKYGTFEGYLKERWDIAKQTGYQQLAAAEFIQKLEHSTKIDSTETSAIADKTATVLPANEGQVRPLLTCLNHDGERLKVWQDVVQDGEKITASLVQRKVDEFKASGLVVEDVEIKLPSVTDKDLRTEAEKIREAKREKIIASLESVSAIGAKATQGLYDVIVLDPPWAMQKIERDVRPNQSEFDYPTMSEDELAELAIPAADNCHVWVWTTHKFLPMALRLIDAWGMKYVCAFTWHKPGGFQPIGLPQYNCEFALYARKGTPEFIDTKAFPVCFNAPRGAHSEKPQEFYDVVRRVTAGRKLDMFNRRAIEGFDVWGNQSAQANEVAEA